MHALVLPPDEQLRKHDLRQRTAQLSLAPYTLHCSNRAPACGRSDTAGGPQGHAQVPMHAGAHRHSREYAQ